MRNCPSPQRDSVADYDLCVTHSNRPKKTGLQNRRPEIIVHYGNYPAGMGRAHLTAKSNQWPEQDAGWQRALYDLTYKNGRLQDLRAAIVQAAKNRCLLCGVSQPHTLDHFLPKESWPALSILALNLIAVCADCNRNKGTLANAGPDEQFVHPYLDVIPVAPFLHCAPVAAGVLSPAFAVEDCDGMDENMLRRLRWQFATLGLDSVYSAEALIFFGERKDDWAESAALGWDVLAPQIARERASAARVSGPNMWKPAFLQGLIDCPQFTADPLIFLT